VHRDLGGCTGSWRGVHRMMMGAQIAGGAQDAGWMHRSPGGCTGGVADASRQPAPLLHIVCLISFSNKIFSSSQNKAL